MSDIKETERKLIERLITGDETAFRLIFDIYKNKLYGFCLKLTRSEDHAEEIVHDVFLKVWLSRSNINPDLCFGAFLFKITKNLSLNFLKKAASDLSVKRKLLATIDDRDNSTMDLISDHEYEISFEKAIKHLPPQQQLVFKMSRVDGLTHAEIAEKLHLTKGTVKNYMILAVENVTRFLNIHTDKVLLILLLADFFKFL